MVRTIPLTRHLSNEETAALERCYIDERFFDPKYLISGEAVDVLKPDGTPLLMYRPDALPEGVCAEVYPDLRRAARLSFNRGTAAGQSLYRIKRDGTRSRTRSAPPVNSGIVGYADRKMRSNRVAIPHCRTTAFTGKDVDRWARLLPFIRAVDQVFKQTCPERYKVQRAMVEKTTPNFTIKGTAFTTVTVNKNWATHVHKDDGDLPEGFGVMSVIDAGDYKGGYLVFPKYRVAVDMRTRGVLLADVHEYHGNTPLIGEEGAFERISTVFYYRSEMINCGTAVEERARREG